MKKWSWEETTVEEGASGAEERKNTVIEMLRTASNVWTISLLK